MKQTTALRIMNEGHNVFLTGSAGAGKSYTLRQFIKHARDRGLNVAVTASSGVAATILGGSTVHSFASIGIKNGITATDIYNIRKKKPVKDRLEQVDVLIIDEISMLHARQLNMVNYVLKSIRNDFRPFGGVQVIVAGDFCLKDGTRILMANGTLRNIEDIMIGDLVMGPNFKPRKVINLFKGEAQLYKVSQSNGKDYVTTGNHLLALRDDRGNLVTHRVNNFITLPTKEQRSYKGFKVYQETDAILEVNSTLTVTSEGRGSFSGIEVDGDHLFLLEDCTVLHNCQLPPVGPEAPKDRFAFMSRTWLEAEFKICYLTEQHRNANSELNVVLNAIRDDVVTSSHEEILKKTMHSSLGEDATKLYTHNMDVDALNTHKLNNITGESVLYQARTDGDARAIKFLSDNALSPPNLVLKVGAKVMFTKNDTDGAYVNGTLGTIVKFSGGLPIVRTTSGSQIVADWNTWEKQDDFGTVSATYSQIPLRLAWAITVHKCVHPGTYVTTAEGVRRIKDIKDEGQILTEDLQLNSYLNKVVNKVLPSVTLSCPYNFGITTTTDHRLKVFSSSEWEYKEASDVVIGDWLKLALGPFKEWSDCDLSNPSIIYEDIRELPFNKQCDLVAVLFKYTSKITTADLCNLKCIQQVLLRMGRLSKITKKDKTNELVLVDIDSTSIPTSQGLVSRSSLPADDSRLNYVYLQVEDIHYGEHESMCVTVPETGNFIQNGFVGSNCQGLTLDEAEINLSKCFEMGQGYVALSRLRDIEGLRLLGLNNNALKLDPLAKKADVRFRALSEELVQEYGEE